MATITSIVQAKILEPYQLPDWEVRLPIRQLWISFEFWDWVEATRSLHDQHRKIGGRTLCEHMEQLLCDFRCAPRIGAGDIKRMMPTPDGIWKLHPKGMRLYGWAPQKDAMVIIAGALESETKIDKDLNNKRMAQVLEFISANELSDSVERGEIYVVFPPHQ